MKASDELKQKYKVYTGNDAESIGELCDKSGLGITTVRKFALDMVKQGRWKEVKIRGKKGLATAYVKIK